MGYLNLTEAAHKPGPPVAMVRAASGGTSTVRPTVGKTKAKHTILEMIKHNSG